MINRYINDFISKLKLNAIPSHKINALENIAANLRINNNLNIKSKLNFICTHNSRRSQLCQVWSDTMSRYYGFTNILSYSGGTEITQVNKNIINTLIETGFSIKKNKNLSNPIYFVNNGSKKNIKLFSKLYTDNSNPSVKYIAVLNCLGADRSCPHVEGASKRISLPFNDPGEYDKTKIKYEKYRKVNIEIASSMKYLYLNI